LVSNHPYGGIDGIILLSILPKIRPDFKMVANYLLNQIEPLQNHIIPVNPFEGNKAKGFNVSGVKKMLEHVQESPIGIFPAGEVSAMKLNKLKISDKDWHPIIGKLIVKSKVKVVPVYFSGHNSLAFHLLGLLHPSLRTIKLPSELFNKSGKIQVKIGKAITTDEIKDLSEKEALRYIRAKTYAMGAQFKKEIQFPKAFSKTKQAIIEAPVPTSKIKAEIKQLEKNNLLFEQEQFQVFYANAGLIPSILHEIGRLREITFREVGEGTLQKIDLDEFDIHYQHLFIWDKVNHQIVGAYRLGEGDILFRKFGSKGFYLNQLFKIDAEFHPFLYQSLELGRSFISKAYQKKPLPLLLLWKGIHIVLEKNENRFKYLIGPVSISNHFSKLSKDLLVAYIRHNHWDKQLSKLITPRKKFTYQSKIEGKKMLLKEHRKDFKLLDQFIGDIESKQALKVPVLLKKYLKLNAKIISFNIDPQFNNCLDGFLFIQTENIPDDALDMLSRGK
jgi:putative hemolysin